MSYSCPISQERIDSNLVRFISLETAIVSSLFLLSGQKLFILLLFADFTFRFFRMRGYSPFYLVASTIIKRLDLEPKICDEAPKRFALYLGWGMTGVAILLSMADFDSAVSFIAVTLLICSLLESIFEFCVGCILYRYMTKIGMMRR